MLLMIGCGEGVPSTGDAAAGGDADADVDADSDGDNDADGDSDTDADSDADGDSDTDADSDADAGTDADAGPEPCDEQGATRTIDCGFCGTRPQICAADSLWHDDGDCVNPGECRPGAIQEDGCGLCGTYERVCSASCAWNEWSACDQDEGAECEPGGQEVTRDGCEVGDIQERRCSDSCRWEALRECGPDCIGDPRDAGTDAEEVCVPGGPFIMGGADPDNQDDDPEHEVVLYPYFFDRFEATNDRYRECVGDGDCTEPDPFWYRTYDEPDAGRFPITRLEQEQVEAFCAWAERRIPTEAEWEKAARGPSPDRRTYPWGDEPPTCDEAKHGSCPYYEGDEVDDRPAGASPFGVERMTDGVDETTADWYAEDYYAESPRVDPRGPELGNAHAGRGVGEGYPADSFPGLTQRWEGDGGGARCARSAEER
ncbi:MAG: SUMF1/EgtB/PvdO family nonheme iron enzyme [Deltaproteobacteria bacterium]|nr:SUMF1/EgtB/PvdO family nonheme iron enzyme [Deltaproteobacteria bacterium]